MRSNNCFTLITQCFKMKSKSTKSLLFSKSFNLNSQQSNTCQLTYYPYRFYHQSFSNEQFLTHTHTCNSNLYFC